MSSVLMTASTSGVGLTTISAAVRDVYAAEIWFAALPVMKFDQFSTKKTELGVQPGRTIVMPKFGNIKRGGQLTEGRRMESRSMSISTTSLTVYEQGNAIAFTEYLLQTSFYDQLAAASLLLGRDMAIVLDQQLRDVFMTATSVVYARGKASRTALTAYDTFDTTMVKDMVVTLESNNSPKWAGDHYVCFIHPRQARSLSDDNNWINASLYAGAVQIYTGEIGRYHDVRFVSTTMMPNGFDNTVDADTGEYADPGYSNALRTGVSGNGTNIFQCVMFGEYAVGHATALPVELRDNGVTDYGREHGMAWYAIWGTALLETKNIVVGESAGG